MCSYIHKTKGQDVEKLKTYPRAKTTYIHKEKKTSYLPTPGHAPPPPWLLPCLSALRARSSPRPIPWSPWQPACPSPPPHERPSRQLPACDRQSLVPFPPPYGPQLGPSPVPLLPPRLRRVQFREHLRSGAGFCEVSKEKKLENERGRGGRGKTIIR